MSDDEYEIPLQDQRIFGAGLKRKRVHFVPSSTLSSAMNPVQFTARSTSVADRYLSLVLSKSTDTNPQTPGLIPTPSSHEDSHPEDISTPALCEICVLPLPSAATASRPHEATLAHQVCLQHSHPPSHLDRSRLGLRYLQSQGWDPDSRQGLGAHGQGIQFPIKAMQKDNKMGLGLVFPIKKGIGMVSKRARENLDAGKVRKLEERGRRKRERLQELFYRSEDVDRYLRTS